MHMPGLYSISTLLSRLLRRATRALPTLAVFGLALTLTGTATLATNADTSRFKGASGKSAPSLIESETIGPKTAPLPAGPYKVRIETTHGVIDVELFPKKAPLSVANFLQLVDSEFFNGTVFHRVVANFMIQTGGYDAKLSYRTPPRTVPNESRNGLKNRRGTLAMARREHPDSADSQFFINMRDNRHLDPVAGRAGYSVFGKVIAGMDVADRIELSDTNIQAGMAAVPEQPIEIISATRLP